MLEAQKRSRLKHIYIISVALVLLLSVVFFIMYKYQVEGEKNLPFNVTKLIVVSSAETENFEKHESTYQANVIQKNDIYIAIEKNNNYKKQDAIKKVVFNNFEVIETTKTGDVKIYRTSQGDKTFEYIDNYLIKDEVTYEGSKETNLKQEQMTISNQGGLIELSAIIDGLGVLTYAENENITSDGRLLNKIDLNVEDIKTKISFDMIIELTSKNKFKTTITLDLPTGDITSEGVVTTENTELSRLVFKRI